MAHTAYFLVGYILSIILTLECEAGGPLRSQFPKHDGHVLSNGVDPGEPLFLTPYIKNGQIQEARNLSMVTGLACSGCPDVKSYSGFLTVNETYNSNMFFWLFPAVDFAATSPLLLWLQGGPGGSSLFGLFVENGPYEVNAKIQLFPRNYTWTKGYNMLYIDNPVQTGFSFTKDKKGMATNEAEVGENLYRAVSQILLLFPEYQQVPFYITGESYAGKYIPALAHRIHNEPEPKNINLKGVAIGDGFTDPPVMIYSYADFMFQTGLLDENQAAYFSHRTDYIGNLIEQGKYKEAFEEWDMLLSGDVSGTTSYFTNMTGCFDYYNYLRTKSPPDMQYYNKFLALPEVRKAIHVGNLTYNSGEEVEMYLLNDVFQSAKPWLAETMENYKVLLYNGHLDIIVALPLTEAMLQTVQWSGLDAYKNATRNIWKVNPFETEVAGYVRKVKDFYQIGVRGGGHILPYDQPRRAFDMIHRFVSGVDFF